MKAKKKNNKHFIIPASYFKSKGITPIKVSLPENQTIIQHDEAVSQTIDNQQPEEVKGVESVQEEQLVAKKIAEKRPQIILNTQKKTSGLSLSSIRKKKEHQIRQMDVILDEEDLPKEAFTEEALIESWNEYVGVIEKKGKFNLASILRIDTPKLQDTTIHLEFPNSTNKVELERQKSDLLRHLRTHLNNFDIDLSISVNETLEKQYAYTPQEKYEKLKEKNKNLELLRRTFDLDF